MSKSKLIRIPSRGRVITDRGYIPTPIRIPYRETIDNIFRMLSTTPTPTIIECLPDGNTVELNAQNFDKDNTIVRPEISPASIIPSVNNVEQKTDDPAQTPVEGGETEVQTQPIVNTNKKNKNKNKNKQQGSSENITVDPEKVE